MCENKDMGVVNELLVLTQALLNARQYELTMTSEDIVTIQAIAIRANISEMVELLSESINKTVQAQMIDYVPVDTLDESLPSLDSVQLKDLGDYQSNGLSEIEAYRHFDEYNLHVAQLSADMGLALPSYGTVLSWWKAQGGTHD